MKCICGYEYDFEYSNGSDMVITKGNKPFLRLFLSNDIELKKRHEKPYEEPYEEDVSFELFACPKCGTVKIEIFP